MRLIDRLNVLNEFGWHCSDAEKAMAVRCTQMQVRQCVWCDGLLFGVPRSVYLDVISGHVLLIGELRDVEWDAFLEWLRTGVDPDATPVQATHAVVPSQRSLF